MRVSDNFICVIDPRCPGHECVLGVTSSDPIGMLLRRIPFDLNVKCSGGRTSSYQMSYRKIPMEEHHTLHDYCVSLFCQLLKLRARLLEVENNRVIYSVQICDDFDTSRPNGYLLSVEYNDTVNKLYYRSL